MLCIVRWHSFYLEKRITERAAVVLGRGEHDTEYAVCVLGVVATVVDVYVIT